METLTEKPQTLSFYTLGPDFTNLLRSFIEEGSFKRVYEVLEEGGFNAALIKQFFLYELKFEGDTRTKEGLYSTDETESFDLNEIYTTAIATCMVQQGLEIYEWRTALRKDDLRNYSKDFEYLNRVFSKGEIIELAAVAILEREHYFAKKKNDVSKSSDGVVLRNGTFITCSFQDHLNLYPILFELGLSTSSQWTDDEAVIHVSSGTMSGRTSNTIDHEKDYWQGEGVTDAQVDSIFHFRDNIKGEYGGYKTKTTARLLLDHVAVKENFGGKYNNLAFLKRFYPDVNLPIFSKEKLDGKFCIRTSPKQSMPGLLNSKFDINENSINEIESEFKECVKQWGKEFKDNELHYFYQEYLTGENGVCHYWDKNTAFKYAMSKNQGDVVKGVQSNSILSFENENLLRKTCRKISEDLDSPIQVEFVVQNDVVYIVQLRLLKNNATNFGVKYSPNGEVLVSGVTFSTGSEYGEQTYGITREDILIVDSEAESKELIGKKALIVKSDVEFSHILALSKQLGVPSMFNTGEIDETVLTGKLDFVAKNESAWITKCK